MDLVVRVAAFPRPGETVPGKSLAMIPGGKGENQAVAAARMGVPVEMVGAVGEDAFGPQLRENLRRFGVGTDYVSTVPGSSGIALIAVDDSGQNEIMVVPGGNHRIPPDSLDRCLGKNKDSMRYIVSQLEVPQPLIWDAFAKARRMGIRTVLNPSPIARLSADFLKMTDLVVLNEIELAELTGVKEIKEGLRCLANSLADRGSVVVTLGNKGLVAFHEGSVIERAIPEVVQPVDTTGAGDCFCGTLIAAICRDLPFEASLHQAQRAAGLSVTKPGASVSFPKWEEL
ncbi:MAG: ribokinase [Pirellulales bacterium]|nr:ribokinase [Pirellulales bacterium]